jgi:tRNA(fMet)-specific endonuclease VapC
MPGRFLLDTNIIIALFARDASVQEHLRDADETFVPIFALGELHYGAHKSEQVLDNLARIDDFAANTAVLRCDSATARQYGEIKNALREKGRPIPENDIWIAAIARQHGLALVSRDEHFKEIDELSMEVW